MKQKKVRVILDSRDGSKDQFIPESKALAMYNTGRLCMDLTNNCYCTRNEMTEVEWMIYCNEPRK